jgi:hypothetical protein
MCLITRQKKALIAEEDIKVYKILKKDGNAIYQNFQYKLVEVYKAKIKKSLQWNCLGILDIDWLHENYPSGWRQHKELICLGAGLHSINKLETAKIVLLDTINNDSRIFEAIIPKGSEYYKDEVGFMISSSLVINKMLRHTYKSLTKKI